MKNGNKTLSPSTRKKYLNNRLEQDHRGIKQREYPRRGFGTVEAAAHQQSSVGRQKQLVLFQFSCAQRSFRKHISQIFRHYRATPSRSPSGKIQTRPGFRLLRISAKYLTRLIKCPEKCQMLQGSFSYPPKSGQVHSTTQFPISAYRTWLSSGQPLDGVREASWFSCAIFSFSTLQNQIYSKWAFSPSRRIGELSKNLR